LFQVWPFFKNNISNYISVYVFVCVYVSEYLPVYLCVSMSVCVCVDSIVSENGASVYSASEQAQKELPIYDVSLRGAGMIHLVVISVFGTSSPSAATTIHYHYCCCCCHHLLILHFCLTLSLAELRRVMAGFL